MGAALGLDMVPRSVGTAVRLSVLFGWLEGSYWSAPVEEVQKM